MSTLEYGPPFSGSRFPLFGEAISCLLCVVYSSFSLRGLLGSLYLELNGGGFPVLLAKGPVILPSLLGSGGAGREISPLLPSGRRAFYWFTHLGFPLVPSLILLRDE